MAEEKVSTLLAKAFSVMILFVMSFVLGVLVLIYGWGLHPVSWFWIIGGAVGSAAIYIFLAALK